MRCSAARSTTYIRPCTARPARREGGRLCVMEHQGWCLLVTPGILAACVVLSCFTVLFSPCASYILSIDVVYRLPVCNHCITSNVNQACALLGLPREKPWMVPSLFSRPKPKPSQHAVTHCIDYGYCTPRALHRAKPALLGSITMPPTAVVCRKAPIDLTPPRARSRRHCLREAPRHDGV